MTVLLSSPLPYQCCYRGCEFYWCYWWTVVIMFYTCGTFIHILPVRWYGFADNASLFYSSHSILSNVLALSQDIEIISEYLNLRLTLASRKSFIFVNRVLFKLGDCPDLTFNGHIIETLREHKYLGVYVDEHLTWD